MIQSNALQESAENQLGVWVCCSGTPHGLGSHVVLMVTLQYVRLQLFTTHNDLTHLFLAFIIADKSPQDQLDNTSQQQTIEKKKNHLQFQLRLPGLKVFPLLDVKGQIRW